MRDESLKLKLQAQPTQHLIKPQSQARSKAQVKLKLRVSLDSSFFSN